MTKKIDKLLAVLGMPKWKQANYLFNSANQKPYKERKKDHWYELANAIDSHDAGSETADHLLDLAMSLLAFRLRDEVGVIGNMHRGIKSVCDKLSPKKDYIEWWTYEAQPIHWIIASLIAKELVKDEG